MPLSLERVDQLTREGWVQSPAGTHVAILQTQLYETRHLIDQASNTAQVWYQPDQAGAFSPVVLAFSIDHNPAPQQTPMLNPFPLPQMGEYAFVEQDGSLFAYHIMVLPLEARQRWVALGDMLKELSSPLKWPAFTERHQLATREQEYHNALLSLAMRQKLALEPTKTELVIQEAMLKGARMHVEELYSLLKKRSLLEQWRAVQGIARELARDYQEYHQHYQQQQQSQQATPLETLPAIAASQGIEEKPARRRRSLKVPTGIVAKDRQAITVNSDFISREIINSLRDKNAYTPYPEQGLAEYTRQFYKERGQIIVTIKPLESEAWETVLSALNTLGDACIDTYIAVMAIAIDRNGTDHIRTPFLISPDDILEVCEKKKSHRSYTPLQRAEVIKHLKTLSQAHVIATMPGPGRRRGRKTEDTVLRAEGAIIDLLSFKIGEYSTITGEEIWEKRSIAIGQWVTMIPELNSTTATMLRQVLAYSAKNERYQKRLGVYLTFMFRINARRGGVFECSMSALLEGAGIVAPRERDDFRKAIESALARLYRDRVIGEYTRIVDASQERETLIHEHARGWWDLYSAQTWRFSPPDYAREQYHRILKEPAASNG